MSGHVLTPLDGSRFAEAAIPFASAIASRAGWNLHLLHVHIPDPRLEKVRSAAPRREEGWARKGRDRALEARRAYLEGTVERYGLRVGSLSALDAGGEGIPSTICRYAEELSSNLIVMSTHGRTGVERVWLGSVADALSRATCVPVLLVRSAAEGARLRSMARVRQVLIPLDTSPVAERILPRVLHLGSLLAWSVRLLHVVPTRILFGARSYPLMAGDLMERHRRATEYLRGVAARFEERDIPVETMVVEDEDPARAIVSAAEEHGVDLVAMASHGRGGLTRAILGSVTDGILSRSRLPLLLGGGGSDH